MCCNGVCASQVLQMSLSASSQLGSDSSSWYYTRDRGYQAIPFHLS